MDWRSKSTRKLLGKIVTVQVDRPIGYLHGDILYPVNYGFVPGLMGGDGEEQDAYILGVDTPLSDFTGRVIAVIREMSEANKPIAAICHGPQMLVTAGVLKGRACTCYPAVKPDVIGAGATWVEGDVCVDDKLVTAPAWPSHPAWMAAFLKVLGTRIEA